MNKEQKYLFLVLIITIVLKSVYLIFVFRNSGTTGWSDDWTYISYGKSIASGNFFPEMSKDNPSFIVGPLIPIIVAFFNLLFGDSYWPFMIYNVIISSLSVVLLYYIGKILLNKHLGFFLSAWGVFFPEYFKYIPHVVKEPTICFLIILLIYLILKYFKNRHLNHMLVSGIVFILLIHADERYAFLFPILIMIPLMNENKITFTRSNFKEVLILTGLILVLMIPWTIRNYLEYKELVILTPRTTAFTSKIWGTNISSLSFDGEEGAIKHKERYLENALKQGEKYGITPRLYNKTESRIRAFINYWQPAYFRPTYIQYGYRFQKWSLAHNVAGIIFYGLFLPFFILGVVRIFKKVNKRLIWLLSIPLLHSLIHAYMVWPLERYRMPINFIIVLIAIYYLIETSKNLNRFWLLPIKKSIA